jgi:putative Ca2+/H+ antiporter (TMEM165/GDT1 family)
MGRAGVLSPLNWHAALVAFGLIFLSELGDKTQLATLMLSAHGHPPAAVFCGAAAALVLVALISALAGDALAHALPRRLLHAGAGATFLLLGGLLLTGRM